MQPELAQASPRSPLAGLTPAWQAALGRLGVSWTFLILLFFSDWRAMAGQWWDSSTYNHVLLVPAILGWLVWLRKDELLKLHPDTWVPGMVPLCGALALWLLGSFSGLTIAREAGAVAMLPASAMLLLGPRVAAGLTFPLGYMALLVPFGDELVPPMQTITAKLTVMLTHLSGVPARIDGVFIDTPAGLFVVAEACSGVKFLIAMIAFAVLVANVCFRSWPRRIAFLAVATVVPVLANGARAWGTIYVAQSMGAAYATGFDHIVYGWIFFAVVIAMVLALSWRWFDRSPDDPMIDAARIEAVPLLTRLSAMRLRPVLALLAIMLVTMGVQTWANAAERLAAPLAKRIDFAAAPGWHRVDYAPTLAWQPRASGAEHRLLGSFADDAGHRVDVFFAVYSGQGEGKEAGGFGEGALTPDSAWAWADNGPAMAGASTERLIGDGRIVRFAQTSYRTGDLLTGSNARLKLANMTDRLLLRARPTMLLILSSEDHTGYSPTAAIAAFRQSVGPLGPWMDRMAQVR
jgi:exosortase A